jgi:hypothetical protein
VSRNVNRRTIESTGTMGSSMNGFSDRNTWYLNGEWEFIMWSNTHIKGEQWCVAFESIPPRVNTKIRHEAWPMHADCCRCVYWSSSNEQRLRSSSTQHHM